MVVLVVEWRRRRLLGPKSEGDKRMVGSSDGLVSISDSNSVVRSKGIADDERGLYHEDHEATDTRSSAYHIITTGVRWTEQGNVRMGVCLTVCNAAVNQSVRRQRIDPLRPVGKKRSQDLPKERAGNFCVAHVTRIIRQANDRTRR